MIIKDLSTLEQQQSADCCIVQHRSHWKQLKRFIVWCVLAREVIIPQKEDQQPLGFIMKKTGKNYTSLQKATEACAMAQVSVCVSAAWL